MFFKSQQQINPYTDYFEKEGLFLFIDWVKNVMNDNSSHVYVIAHSNIMQATLVNICQLTTKNPLIEKKTLDQCHPDFSVIKHENIWEMALTTSLSFDGSMLLESMTVREGEDPPNVESTNVIDLNQEMSCFNKEIRVDNTQMPTKTNASSTSFFKKLVPSNRFFSSLSAKMRPVGGKKKQTRRKVNRRKNTRKQRN